MRTAVLQRSLDHRLDPDAGAKLRERAAGTGQEPEAYAREAVLEKHEGLPTLAEIPVGPFVLAR